MTYVQEKKHLQQMADTLAKDNRCNFNKKSDIEHLQRFYVDRFGKGKLDRSKFRDFVVTLGITDDTIMDRVFKVFDLNNDGHVCMEEWIRGLSIWLKGSEADHTEYTFKVYDMNEDGHIGRDDMFNILKKAVIKHTADEDPEEGTRELVDMCMKCLDMDRDQNVSSEDFRKACQEDCLHMEILGQCIPRAVYLEGLEEAVFRPKISDKKWY